MAYYIKIDKRVADKIGAPVENRAKTADGKVLLWQADLNVVPGDDIFERAAFVGGVALSPVEAKEETDGRCVPAEVVVPEVYRDKEEPIVVPEEHIVEPEEPTVVPEEPAVVPEETGSSTHEGNNSQTI